MRPSARQGEREAPVRQPRSSAASRNPPIELGALADSVAFFVLRANRKLSHAWGRKERRPLFYCAFALIGANPGISPVELARFLVLDKSRASDLIDTLESEQAITRRRHCEDHRRLGVYLTPAGTARLASVLAELGTEDERLRRLFSEDERRQLIAFLARIAAG